MTPPDASGNRWSLSLLPAPARFLCLVFLMAVVLAYSVALLFVFVQSDLRPAGIAQQFRGDDPDAPARGAESDPEITEEPAAPDSPPGLSAEWNSRHAGMRFAKPLREMILTTHVHLLSISMLYFLVGGIFSASSFPARAKPWVIGGAFAGLIGVYASMWATRYGHPAFSFAVYAFGLLQTLSLALQILAGVRDLAPIAKKR